MSPGKTAPAQFGQRRENMNYNANILSRYHICDIGKNLQTEWDYILKGAGATQEALSCTGYRATRTGTKVEGMIRSKFFYLLFCLYKVIPGGQADNTKGAPRSESRTGPRLVSPPAADEKKNWNPLYNAYISSSEHQINYI